MTSQALLYVLLREIPDNPDVLRLYGEGSHQLEAIAHVLASDQRLSDAKQVTFIVRSQPSPLLGVLGYFDAAQQPRIEMLPSQIARSLQYLRYVDYQQAEQDCEQLATRLVQEIGDLDQYHFVGIPRGGLIVLGMLAYALKLSPHQLTPSSDAPLVVVDDCSISGARFRQFLKSHPNDRVVFAPLYAPPALKEKITAQEPRVQACVSAQSLHDYAHDYFQDDYEAWRARWYDRRDDVLYWVGLTEHVCFAWNEPDTSFWNPVLEEEEPGWRLIPDKYCLKNRVNHQNTSVSIQHQPAAKGQLKPAPSVLFGTLEQHVIVANIETGANLQLADVAADMWNAIINNTDLDTAAAELLTEYDVDEAMLKADLQDFAAAMQQQGILTS